MTSSRTYEVTYENDVLDYSETLEVEVDLVLEGGRDDEYVTVRKMWIDGHEVKLTTLANEIEEDGDLIESLIEDMESYRADCEYDAMMDAKMDLY